MPRPKRKPKHGGPRPGAGAKALRGSAAETRLSIRLTDAEAARLRAGAGDQPLAEWARETLLASLERDSAAWSAELG